MNMPYRTRTAGYVLVTVLILTLIASMVVFVSLRQNLLLERMGGNQQKMLNASLAAGQGVAASLDIISRRLAAGTYLSEIKSNLESQRNNSYAISHVEYTSSTLSFISKGTFQGAVAYKHASFALTSGTYPFNAGLVACNSLVQTGSGHIDSYDSSLGKYDPYTNISDKSSVKVLDATGLSMGLNLSGGTRISGSVFVNGNATLSTGTRVTNQITTSKNLSISGGAEAGSALVGGMLSLDGGSRISGSASIAGESVSISGGSSVGTLVKNVAAPVITPENCDPLSIETAIKWPPSRGDSIQGSHWWPRFDKYSFNPQSANIYTGSNNYKDGDPPSSYTKDIYPVSVELFGESKSAYVLDKLDIASSTLDVSCPGIPGGKNEVTLVVLGDFTMSDSSPRIHVADKCSLNIIVKNNTNLSQGSIAVDSYGAGNTDGKPPLAIYSASKENSAVKIGNGFSAGYASIYAPLTKVSIANGSGMAGAVRAKDLELSGAGGMHYDEGLAKTSIGGSSGSVKLVAIQDYYPAD